MIITKHYFEEDMEQFELEQRAGKFQSVLYSFYELYLRKRLRHEEMDKEVRECLEEVEQSLLDNLESYGLSTDDLYR